MNEVNSIWGIPMCNSFANMNKTYLSKQHKTVHNIWILSQVSNSSIDPSPHPNHVHPLPTHSSSRHGSGGNRGRGSGLVRIKKTRRWRGRCSEEGWDIYLRVGGRGGTGRGTGWENVKGRMLGEREIDEWQEIVWEGWSLMEKVWRGMTKRNQNFEGEWVSERASEQGWEGEGVDDVRVRDTGVREGEGLTG